MGKFQKLHAMETIPILFAITGAITWLTILLLPWRPWATREILDASSPSADEDLSDITVLIPARNEADMLQTTLPALNEQGGGLNIIIVDDQSIDGTSEAARGAGGANLHILRGKAPPDGWSGKLWALEQGRSHLSTSLVLLLDADIKPLPGIIAELRKTMREKNVHLISLMAVLRMETFWERLLMPAFIYFFKLLYPFHLSNSSSSRVAAAAGGCILLETRVLDEIGGFNSLRGALIDDCALAKKVKSRGYRTWMGLSHSVRSLRPYNTMRAIWNMVARTAFTQLRYSKPLLLLCTVIMLASFGMPGIGLLLSPLSVKLLSAFCLVSMVLTYLPTLKFYRMSVWWAFAMPLISSLYLAMTWTSAINHWRGQTSQWKGRPYTRL
jgi:hopene-associated glycosyltransferase HpnB